MSDFTLLYIDKEEKNTVIILSEEIHSGKPSLQKPFIFSKLLKTYFKITS